MSPLLLPLLLAATATAQVTTSIRMPSPYHQDDTHIGFLASVVAVSSGSTTLALHFDNATNLQTAGYMIDHAPNTMTFTRDAFAAVSTQAASTVTYGCSFVSPASASAGGICSFVSDGPGMHASVCAEYASATAVPEFCAKGSSVPESLRAHTYAIEDADIATYQVVITAGTEKLSAKATPTGGVAAPTGTMASVHRGQNVVPVETGAPAPAPAPAQAEGAAGAVGAMSSVLLGGVAVVVAMLV